MAAMTHHPGVLALFLAVATGCDESRLVEELPPPPPCPAVSVVSVAPDGLTLAPGDSVQMQAVGPAGCGGGPAAVVDSVTWTSSNPRIVQVGRTTGLARALAPGLAAIRATLYSRAGGAGNGVATLRVASFRIDPPVRSLRVGEEVTFHASRNGAEGPIPVRWSLSRPEGGTISAAGAFKACWPAGPIDLLATAVEDSTLTSVAALVVMPIQESNPIESLRVTESAGGGVARLDSLSGAVEVTIPVRGNEFACHQVTRMRLELRDAGGGSALLADDSVQITSPTNHRIHWLPSNQRAGAYQLIASAVIDGRSIVEGPPLSVRIQLR